MFTWCKVALDVANLIKCSPALEFLVRLNRDGGVTDWVLTVKRSSQYQYQLRRQLFRKRLPGFARKFTLLGSVDKSFVAWHFTAFYEPEKSDVYSCRGNESLENSYFRH
jgi:hypothetical protein